jgi:hypothetical protein
MKSVDVLQKAIDGIIAAGISPVPLEVVVALAAAIGPHIANIRFEDGRIKSAEIHFEDHVGMTFKEAPH